MFRIVPDPSDVSDGSAVQPRHPWKTFRPVNNLVEAVYSIHLTEERVEKIMEAEAKMMKASA